MFPSGFCAFLPFRFRASFIVGYGTQKVFGNNQFTWSVATFQQIGKDLDKQTLSAFSLPTDRGFSGSDVIELQTYDETGAMSGRYYFLDAVNADIEVGDSTATGWYDGEAYLKDYSWVCCNTTKIPFGAGTMLMSGEDDLPMTFSGQVVSDEVATTLYGGNQFTWFGNCSPTEIKLGDVAIPADLGFSSSDVIELQTYNESGAMSGRYYFLDAVNADIEVGDETATGWYDGEAYLKDYSWVCCNETVKLASGQMFMLMSGESDTTISIPSALTK